jgi:diguanylate cyclase (GGDEF)-like protein
MRLTAPADDEWSVTTDDSIILRDIIAAQNEIAAKGLDLQAVIDVISELAMKITGADGGLVQMVEGNQVVYRAACGIAAPQIGRRAGIADSLVGTCIREASVVTSDDTREDPRVDGDASRRLGAISVICTPLLHEGAVEGVLTVYRSQAGALGTEHQETLGMLAEIIAAQMSHPAACEQGRRANREDALTGLGNRRAYDERLAVEIARAERHDRPLSLVIIDVDSFTEHNERLGEARADEMLVTVASALRAVRGTDEAFRIGGDEFAVLLPETAADGLPAVAARIRRHLDAANATAEVPVDVSFGGCQMRVADPIVLHAEADVSLYAAKRRRNDRPERALHAV